jgi:hypothetical protein
MRLGRDFSLPHCARSWASLSLFGSAPLRGFDLYEADKGVAHLHRVIGAGLECREGRFANSDDVPRLEEEDLRYVCDQGFQRCPDLVLGCADRSLAGKFLFEGCAEAGNRIGHRIAYFQSAILL